MPEVRRYACDWSESVALPDGTRLTLRTIRPSDKELLQRGMQRLSPESLRQRFLVVRSALSPAELSYLTEVDGENHWAICGVLEHEPSQGVATARVIRMAKGSDEAEIAVTVIDEYQRRGLGTLLFRHLVAAAQGRGIRAFYVISAYDNVAMQKIAASLAEIRSRTSGAGVTTLIASP